MALSTVDDHWTSYSHYSASSSYPVGGAVGERDVMIIASSTAGADRDAVARLPGSGLTQQDRERLSTQGVARELQGDDLSIAQARISLDGRSTLVAVEGGSGTELSSRRILEQIEKLMQHTEKHGVILYYIGPGRRHTGDWCFNDGYINFADIAALYKRHLRGRVLTIVSDCSHSGAWVRACMALLDREGAGPCGHAVRDCGYLLKIYASCQRHEIPSRTRFSAWGVENDKNTGRLTFIAGYQGRQLGASQQVSGVDFTRLRCGAGSIKEECLLGKSETWSKWAGTQRVPLLPRMDREPKAFVAMDHVRQHSVGEQPNNDVREWNDRTIL